MWEKWSDDRLPNGQFRYGPFDLADHARRLERQRDELLEALVELRDWYLENTGLPAAKANGAIAAVKGGTP
jgi:hypothetical protein